MPTDPTKDRTAAAADRLLGIEGHETFAYGQSSYDGDACRACTWQGPPRSGAKHTAETRRAALIAVLAEHEVAVAGGSVDARSRAHPAAGAEGTIAVPRPHVPHGPVGVPADQADADYLREAARKLAEHYKPFGSNLRATVVKLLHDTADAIAGAGQPDAGVEPVDGRTS